MGEVYSIGFDLSALEKAFKLSEKIKANLSGLKLDLNCKGLSNKNTKNNSSDFSKNIIDSNKGLKEQNKLLGGSLQKLNLIRLVSSKIKWGALGAIGLAGTGITAGIAAMNGTLQTNTRAKNTGLNFGESNALNFAGKMTGIGEDTLISSIEGLTTSLADYSKWGNFASLGLNASDLQNKNPTEALFEVLESMKDSDLPKYMKKQIIDNIGVPFDQFQFVLKEGTGEIQKYFKEGMGMFGGKSGKSLMAGERALIRFTTILKDVSQNIGGKIAPALTTGLKLITPYIYKLADGFTWLLGKVINKRNLNIVSGLFDSIGKIGGNLISKGMDIFSGGKDLFKNMFAGFSVDTGGWSSILKELGKSLLSGFSNLWEKYKKYLISLGQSIVDVWKTIEPDLMSFIQWFQKDILPSLISIGGSYINILASTITKLSSMFTSFWKLIRPVFVPFGIAIKTVFNIIQNVFKGFEELGGVSKLLDVSPLGMVLEMAEWWKEFKTSGQNIWDFLKEKLNEKFIEIKNDLANIWKMVKQHFLIMITGIVDGINFILDKLKQPVIKWGYGFDPITDKFSKRVYTGKGKDDWVYSHIDDGVITKTGQVIKTDPQDYIFAMKQPQKLASSASGGGTYTININANVRHDNDVKQIKTELERLIRSFNSKR